jgi:hypothetical protein
MSMKLYSAAAEVAEALSTETKPVEESTARKGGTDDTAKSN